VDKPANEPLPNRDSGEEDSLLARLNDEQARAVTQEWGPSLVIAGAGSGKTTVLMRRIAWIIERLHQEPDLSWPSLSQIRPPARCATASRRCSARVSRAVWLSAPSTVFAPGCCARR